MGWKKKVKKNIKSFEERIQEHKKKKEEYINSGGKDYKLVEYWEDEIERLKKFKKEKEDKLRE